MSSHDFQPILQSFLPDPSLPFADVLSEETIQRVARDAGVPIDPQGERISFTGNPAITASRNSWS